MVLLLLPAVIGSARMKMLIDPWSLIHLASGATVVSVSLPASVAGAGVVVVVVVVVVIWTWLKHPWTLLCQCNYMISVLSTEKKIVTGNSNFHLGQEELEIELVKIWLGWKHSLEGCQWRNTWLPGDYWKRMIEIWSWMKRVFESWMIIKIKSKQVLNPEIF